MFAKVFSQIFDSSIAEDYVVRHVFTDLLILADKDGIVDMTVSAISRRTNVPEEIIVRSIAKLTEPDISSRSHLEDGRRLVLIDSHRAWGWQIVNYEHYRNLKDEETRRAYFRDKKREYRANAKKSNLSTSVQESPTRPTLSTQAEAEAEAEAEARKATTNTLVDSEKSSTLFGEEPKPTKSKKGNNWREQAMADPRRNPDYSLSSIHNAHLLPPDVYAKQMEIHNQGIAIFDEDFPAEIVEACPF